MNNELTLDKKLFGTKTSPLHPNKISLYSTTLTPLAVTSAFIPEINIIAPIIGTISYVGDTLDGKIARHFKLTTQEGAKLDPLFDKDRNFIIGGAAMTLSLASGNICLPIAIGYNFYQDFKSQIEREKNGTNANLTNGLKIFKQQHIEAYNACIHTENCEYDKGKKTSKNAVKAGQWKTGIQAVINNIYLGTFATLPLIANKFNLEYSNFEEPIYWTMTGALAISGELCRKGRKQKAELRKLEN